MSLIFLSTWSIFLAGWVKGIIVAYGILVSDPVPIGLWILTVLGLGLGLGLGGLDFGLGLDNNREFFLAPTGA